MLLSETLLRSIEGPWLAPWMTPAFCTDEVTAGAATAGLPATGRATDEAAAAAAVVVAAWAADVVDVVAAAAAVVVVAACDGVLTTDARVDDETMAARFFIIPLVWILSTQGKMMISSGDSPAEELVVATLATGAALVAATLEAVVRTEVVAT